MFKSLLLSLLSFLVLTSPVVSHPGHDHSHTKKKTSSKKKEKEYEKGNRNYEYDEPDETIEAALIGEPLEYDASLLSAGDSLWYAWVEYVRGKGDRIWIGQRHEDQWISRKAVLPEAGSYSSPRLTFDSRGEMWLSFEAEKDGQWDVFVTRLVFQPEPRVTQWIQVSESPGPDTHHQVVADQKGSLWFVWQGERDGQFEIFSRRVEKEKLSPVERISDSPHGDWHPQVAISDGDELSVVWDGYDGNSFNIYLRSKTGDNWSSILPVACDATFEGRAQIAVDQQNRKWICWEEGKKNWGKPYRGIRTEELTNRNGPLHGFRRLKLAMVDEAGQLNQVDHEFPMPSRGLALARKTGKEKKEIGSFYERPVMVIDHQNRLWVVYRHYYCPWLGVEHRTHVESGWGVYARYLSGSRWSGLYQFSIGQGDGLQSLDVVPHQDGIGAVWTTGRTHRYESDKPRGIASSVIQLSDSKSASLQPEVSQVDIEHLRGESFLPKPENTKVGGKSYSLFYGDLHRHTDLSLCRVPVDGTIDDAYRYAIDVAQIDFLGITDHSRDIAQGDVQSQLWWRSQKEVGRHQLGVNFFPFFAYERSHGNTADHNVISLRNNLLRPYTYPVPEFWKELDSDTITIPHQPIRRDTWKYQNDQLRPLVEIFQGCRDTSIEDFVHKGFSKGYHLGFIASSDHMSTSASYACVWAEEPSRESIFRAMQARRTYGATTNIRLIFRAGNHWMGERVMVEKIPPLFLEADGTGKIETIHLIIDGEVKKTMKPGIKKVKLEEDIKLVGNHYVYFHLIQSDGNEAWSSPIWFEKKNLSVKSEPTNR